VLDAMAALDAPPLGTLSPQEHRAASEAQRAATPPGPDMHRVEDHEAPGPNGAIPVRVYWPSEASDLPVLVWFHQGGWVIGSVDGSDHETRHLAEATGRIVISVDYRLAPEHPAPAAYEDAYAATVWAAEHATELGGDPSRVAVGGASAGGNLAAVVSQMARDQDGPAITHQVMVYPVIDYEETASYEENAEGYLLTRNSMRWFWDLYAPDGVDRSHPYLSPLRAESLAELPPALVITAEFDPLRDEGEAYARRLSEAGVPVVCSRYDGQIHAFMGMPHILDDAKRAYAEIGPSNEIHMPAVARAGRRGSHDEA
jgi:acetyl esterase